MAGALWYSQFFGLSLGKGFLTESPTLMTLSFCVLMALNVTFANVWGIILKEWRGCTKKTIAVLVLGLCILVLSSFLPELLYSLCFSRRQEFTAAQLWQTRAQNSKG